MRLATVRFILILVSLLSLIFVGVWFATSFWYRQQLRESLRTPLVPGSPIYVEEFSPISTAPKRVYGYLPYWTLLSTQPDAVLTDVSYFSITLGKNGEIVESTASGPDMGLRRMQGEFFTEWMSEREQLGQRPHITFTMLNNDDITAFLLSPQSQQAAIENISQVMASYPFAGLNLDIEYAGQADSDLRAAYTQFVADVRYALTRQNPGAELSVAFFGSAASKPLLWDIAALDPHVDIFVMMAYDYHYRGSPVAGPVAPIFGRESKRWQDDIISNLRDLTKLTKPSKVLLGVPFYGYEWQVTHAQPGANTYPRTGATATYDRVQKILNGQTGVSGLRTGWDEDALSPYLTYQRAGNTQIIFYEDARSLSYKLDLVQQVGLAGIAIWAIGYEGDSSDFWQVIESKIGTSAR